MDRNNFVGPPCPYLSHATLLSPTTVNSPNNCGIDLATADDNVLGQIGSKQVYAYTSGIIISYSAFTLRILEPGLNPSVRYNYTHLAPRANLVNFADEYIVRGTLLGSYGPFGAYGSSENDEHIDTVQVNYALQTYSEPPWGS